MLLRLRCTLSCRSLFYPSFDLPLLFHPALTLRSFLHSLAWTTVLRPPDVSALLAIRRFGRGRLRGLSSRQARLLLHAHHGYFSSVVDYVALFYSVVLSTFAGGTWLLDPRCSSKLSSADVENSTRTTSSGRTFTVFSPRYICVGL